MLDEIWNIQKKAHFKNITNWVLSAHGSIQLTPKFIHAFNVNIVMLCATLAIGHNNAFSAKTQIK